MMDYFATAFFAIFVAIVALKIAVARQRKRIATTQRLKTPAFAWERSKKFAVNVVGESHYQENIERAVESIFGKSVEIEAILVPENTNPFDDKAIMVMILGETVGYLSRAEARKFRARLKRKNMEGQNTSCAASFIGGGRDKSYGVVLDLKSF